MRSWTVHNASVVADYEPVRPTGENLCEASFKYFAVRSAERNRRLPITRVAFSAIKDLSYPDASTSCVHWTNTQKAAIAPLKESPCLSSASLWPSRSRWRWRRSDELSFQQVRFSRYPVAVVESPGQGEEEAIVVEPTPRLYAAHPTWVYSKLHDLDHSPDPLRIVAGYFSTPLFCGAQRLVFSF